MSDVKPECLGTLKPITSCIDCKWAVECVEAHERDYLKRVVR